jgi:hypothetical protein
MSINNKRFPRLDKLSIAILENLIKPIIGEDAIKVIKSPVKEKELTNELISALKSTEERFRNECEDQEIGKLVLDLPLANLPSVQDAVKGFYLNPYDVNFKQLLGTHLSNLNLDTERVNKAIDSYINILRQEFIQISDETRHKLLAWAVLGINSALQTIVSGSALYKQFNESSMLSTYIRSKEFQSLIIERTKTFIGRDYIFKSIYETINDKDFPSGYIIIKGEPGIGKTALIAELVNRGGYVHHFNLSLQNICTTKDFLTNICAQLIAAYKLNYDVLPNDSMKDSGFLSRLLQDVSKKQLGCPTILLVDALDEAEDQGLSPNTNVLCLPSSLPDGIYIVATTREQSDYRLIVDRQKDIYLLDNALQNLNDIRLFILNYIENNKPQMQVRIKAWKISKSKFVKMLTEKSEGNFLYLVHVLKDILSGSLSVDSLDNIEKLPKGLHSYYQRHWRMMRAKDEQQFDSMQEPIVCVFATVREPVTIDNVHEWTRLSVRKIIDTIRQWREFLNVDILENGENLYRIYHSSFQDFLADEVGLRKYHEKIAMAMLKKIPGI